MLAGSIADGKTLADMLRVLQLIDDRHRQVGHGNPRRRLALHQQPVAADAEVAGALARVEEGRWRDKGPVQGGFALDQLQSLACAFGTFLVFGGEVRRVE
ncbi:hypothetical protein D3C86_2011210 [compost metagenome]